MYLTKLRPDPNSAQARRDLADPYEMHRTLSRAFVSDDTSGPGRFLWRLETDGRTWRRPVVLVQSGCAADWRALEAVSGYLAANVETKVVNLGRLVSPGARYRFRLLANPTVSRAGKRYGIVGERDQLAWLERQGRRHGFSVEAAMVNSSGVRKCRKGSTSISVLGVCFEGVLRSREAGALESALVAGIGPAKALGCGLLSVARSL